MKRALVLLAGCAALAAGCGDNGGSGSTRLVVSAAAYGFLALVSYLQKEIFTHLPHGLGFSAEPAWWPLPVLAVGGVLAALAIRYLPGRGGPSPAGGFKLHGPPTAAQLPGVIRAALATLSFGMVLGPEMPLILIGGGLAVGMVRLSRREVPDRAVRVCGPEHARREVRARLGPADGAVQGYLVLVRLARLEVADHHQGVVVPGHLEGLRLVAEDPDLAGPVGLDPDRGLGLCHVAQQRAEDELGSAISHARFLPGQGTIMTNWTEVEHPRRSL